MVACSLWERKVIGSNPIFPSIVGEVYRVGKPTLDYQKCIVISMKWMPWKYSDRR